MLERFEIYFEKEYYNCEDRIWGGKNTISIIYDEIQNKTYCHYDNQIAREIKDIKDIDLDFPRSENRFIVQGNEIIKDIEKSNFRNWESFEHACNYFAHNMFCYVKYNDLNKPTKRFRLNNGVPNEFFILFSNLSKYFTYNEFFKVNLASDFYEISYKDLLLVKTPVFCNETKESKKALKNLTKYIDIFSQTKDFGPVEEYHYRKYIHYIPEVCEFKTEVFTIFQKFRDFDFDMNNPEDRKLYHDFERLPDGEEDYDGRDEVSDNKEFHQVLLAMNGKPKEIEMPSIDYKELLINNKAALHLLIYFFCDTHNLKILNKKRFETALQDGTIVNILQFIKDYNHF